MRRPRARSYFPAAVKESWETGVSLVWLLAQLPFLALLMGLALLGQAAELSQTLRRRK